MSRDITESLEFIGTVATGETVDYVLKETPDLMTTIRVSVRYSGSTYSDTFKYGNPYSNTRLSYDGDKTITFNAGATPYYVRYNAVTAYGFANDKSKANVLTTDSIKTNIKFFPQSTAVNIPANSQVIVPFVPATDNAIPYTKSAFLGLQRWRLSTVLISSVSVSNNNGITNLLVGLYNPTSSAVSLTSSSYREIYGTFLAL